MQLLQCKGEELEKEKKNSPEDFFNESIVKYLDKGNEHELRVLYVRYFEEDLSTFTPFDGNPVMSFGDQTFDLKDIVALVALIKKPGFKHRKRVYINQQDEFEEIFKDLKWDKVKQICMKLADGKPYELESTLEFKTS
ncbi:hypothetical protein [Pontibacillus sp. HMF3514]|uniref:hypothetical protein n=1 Tax=Pontibacillus sp. HMF3514 TaxID=2692425 RepID=UPI0013202A2C|nr:hypothetical protein [Pontibacillus sp. HMF3514]QHE52572.1 hypothetical protein GS400_11250 [Pontibacillus sp. HMF3514]